MASAILVTTSRDFADKVSEEIEGYLKTLSRSEIIRKSLDNYGYALVAETMDEAIETANEIAAEHLEIVTANPFEVMMKIRNAGAIFIGAANRWAIILPDRTTYCRPTELQNSSPRLA